MKKKKRALTKDQREAILKTLSNESPTFAGVTLPTNSNTNVKNKSQGNQPIQATNINQAIFLGSTTAKELKKISLVLAFIVFLLGVATYLNYNTPYLTQAGEVVTKQLGI